jgi:hypothetical protein
VEPTASVHVVVERKIPAPARDQLANPQLFIFSVFANFQIANTGFKSASLSICLPIHIGQLGAPGRSFKKFDILVFFENLSKKIQISL